MKRRQEGASVVLLGILALGTWLAWPTEAVAHCDTLDGPVVVEAKAALESGDVTPIVKWVKQEHEAELRAAFQKTLAVRSMGAEARDLADMYLFETLVRLHREGEDAPYTGLKPAGEVEPPVAAADKAIANGNVDDLAGEIGQAVEDRVRERFLQLIETKKHKDDSVEAGREYVEAYVIFVHFVEGLHNTLASGPHHH